MDVIPESSDTVLLMDVALLVIQPKFTLFCESTYISRNLAPVEASSVTAYVSYTFPIPDTDRSLVLIA